MKRPRCNFRNPDVKPHIDKTRGGSATGLRKLHPDESYALVLERYYSMKYGQVVTAIAVLKTLAVISSTFKKKQKLWVLHVAPSRQLKSQTTNEQMHLFPKRKTEYVGSDFTIHGLIRNYETGKALDKKCLLINDLTLLLDSKADRTKARLVDAFAELASEGRYIYSDFQRTYELKARFSLIANITPDSYFRNRKKLLGNTFTERCLVVYHQLTDEEMSEANLHREERVSLKTDPFKQVLMEDDVKIVTTDISRFNEYAKRWRILGAYSSSSALFDMIKSVAVAYAILSGHTRITEDEYRFLDMLGPHVRNPFEGVKLRILELAHQGRSIRDICSILNRDYEKYRPYVSKTIVEYRRRGVLLPANHSALGLFDGV